MQILEYLETHEPSPNNFIEVFKKNGTLVTIDLAEYFFIVNDIIGPESFDMLDEVLDMFEWNTIHSIKPYPNLHHKFKIAKFVNLTQSQLFISDDE